MRDISSISRPSVRLCVFSIFVVGALARFVCLGSNPAGVFRDEAEKGYSAYSLARIGGVFDFFAPPDTVAGIVRERVHLNRWPLFIDVWGSLTSTIYQYATLPLVAVWGPNAWTVRIPSALVGSLTVLLSFFLARRLTGRLDAALWTMTLMAFSPWHVVFSRWALQGIFVPFFVTCALLAFLKTVLSSPFSVLSSQNSELRTQDFPLATRNSQLATRNSQLYSALLSALAFGLAFYSYSGAQPFLLAFWCALAWVFRRELARQWKATLVGAVVLALATAPTLCATFGGGGAGMAHFNDVSVWATEGSFATHLATVIRNYLSHFSPQFLFLTGDSLDRHGLRGFGVMLHVEIPFLVAGLYVAVRRRNIADRLLLAWFLLFPLSASLTNEGIPHALRTLHAVPCPQILSAMGLVAILDWARRRRSESGIRFDPVREAAPREPAEARTTNEQAEACTTNAKRAGTGWVGRAIASAFALDVGAFLIALFVFYPHYSALDFEYGIRQAIEAARDAADEAGNQDARLLVLVDTGLYGLPELYYFHAKTPPETILREGTPGGRVWFMNGIFAPPVLTGLLQPGESALVNSNMFREGGPYFGLSFPKEIRARPIYWQPRPFSGLRVEVCRVLSRKRKGGS